ncbi:hypothetical protein QS257_04010 [Terrilactibacillus sp. S3-3]|nr:hypothetical protein QS257_04010 [Terrilactibacillus sp. S3-3]
MKKLKLVTLHNEDLALFYLGVVAKISNITYPKIDAINNMDEANNALKFLDTDCYALFLSKKKDAVCLSKQADIYVVSYVDLENHVYVIMSLMMIIPI